ncbi:hypothetical protein F5887DRAFT_1260889 [Amanita rubescens]|nr:hypothetical protein F5887DRAFT_1260889 [Amanita rubescens]
MLHCFTSHTNTNAKDYSIRNAWYVLWQNVLGTDAMNTDCDYSAAYVTLFTDTVRENPPPVNMRIIDRFSSSCFKLKRSMYIRSIRADWQGFSVLVCPHAGGVGLCEYVIHLRLIDYIAISGTTERNVLEYVHEHFLYPCAINSKGRYNVPSNPNEGNRVRVAKRFLLGGKKSTAGVIGHWS